MDVQQQIKEALAQWGQPFQAYLFLLRDPLEAIESFEDAYIGEYSSEREFEQDYRSYSGAVCFGRSPYGIYAFRKFF